MERATGDQTKNSGPDGSGRPDVRQNRIDDELSDPKLDHGREGQQNPERDDGGRIEGLSAPHHAKKPRYEAE